MTVNQPASSGPSAAFEISLVRSVDRATKAFYIDEAGNIAKKGEPLLYDGKAERVFVRDAEHLAGRLSKTPTEVVYVPGQMARPGQSHRLGTKKKAASDPTLITRTKKDFGYQANNPALVVLDIDLGDWPDDVAEKVESAGGVHDVLSKIIPGLSEAARVWRPSVSSGIRNKATGERTGLRGLHIWLFVRDGGDAGRFVDVLHQRLLLEGYGFGLKSSKGSMLIRSLIDKGASGDGSRLVYEANGVLRHSDLEHEADFRKPEYANGSTLDTSRLADLTSDEVDQVRAIERKLRGDPEPGAVSPNDSKVSIEVDRVTQSGHSVRTITGSHKINLDDGRKIKAIDIILDPREFHGKTCADPDEPGYGGGKNKAIIYTDNNCPARIHSQAHGGINYEIALTAQDVLEAAEGGSSA